MRKSIVSALQKLTNPQKEENFKLGIGKGKGKPTKKTNKKANAKNPAAKGASSKMMQNIGAC